MITDADIKKLKSVFATKDDLDDKLKPIHAAINSVNKELNGVEKSLKSVNKTLNTHIRLTDNQLKDHHNRLESLETKTGFKRPAFPVVN